MSTVVHEPGASSATAPVKVACGTCEIPFDAVPAVGEAAYLAGVHNDLHHGGLDDAVVLLDLDADQDADDDVDADDWF